MDKKSKPIITDRVVYWYVFVLCLVFGIVGFACGLFINAVAVSIILHTFDPCELCHILGGVV